MARTLASSSTTSTVCEPSPMRCTNAGYRSVDTAADGMVLGHFDQREAHAIGILDPHLPQPPWLGGRWLEHGDLTGRHQTCVLRVDIAHLQPQGERCGQPGTAELEV